uniref:DUF4271 domain-containing protein n=1 Tax=Flavobacterium sp. TaxID=239 RepID=UPI00404A74A1
MNAEMNWLTRTLSSNEWPTYLWVICLLCLAVAKFLSENQFHEFLRIFSTEKYLKVYKENSAFINWFMIVLYILTMISISFLILVTADYFDIVSKYDGVAFTRILTFFSAFLLSKLLVEKIIAASFGIEEEANQFSFYKISYLTYVGVLLLPLVAIIYYQEQPVVLLFITLGLFFVLTGFSYIKTIQIHQNWLFSRLFYFILYLCALEIIPYYFIFYWLKEI